MDLFLSGRLGTSMEVFSIVQYIMKKQAHAFACSGGNLADHSLRAVFVTADFSCPGCYSLLNYLNFFCSLAIYAINGILTQLSLPRDTAC